MSLSLTRATKAALTGRSVGRVKAEPYVRKVEQRRAAMLAHLRVKGGPLAMMRGRRECLGDLNEVKVKVKMKMKVR